MTARDQRGSRIARRVMSSEATLVDQSHMRHALRLARAAGTRGEVPVGAVAVLDGAVIAAAGNAMERHGDAADHAEMLVLRRAARVLGGWRLLGVNLYVTLEPCPMCAGAMVQARIARCVYGARDPKKGADRSVYDVLRHPRNNHRVAVEEGVLGPECSVVLSEFFSGLRHGRRGQAPAEPDLSRPGIRPRRR